MTESPELAAIKAAIEQLPREDRANLRPWMLAHYDEDGNERPRVTKPPS